MRNAVVDFYPRHRDAKMNKSSPCLQELEIWKRKLQLTVVSAEKCQLSPGFPTRGRDTSTEMWYDFRQWTLFNRGNMFIYFSYEKEI